MAQNRERGFAAMDPEEQREIASMGGRAAHERGTAHEFDSEEAAEAGRLGGESVSRDREHMAEIGRKGGLASHHRNAAFYHDAAAHHHRQAARHHESGDLEEAGRHGELAHGHSTTAHGHSERSRRGFAAMDPAEQRRIASKGGRASHGGRGADFEEDEGENGQGQGGSRRGFAAMDPAEQRRIASKGGRASHGGRGGSSEREEEEDGGGERGGSSAQHAKAGRQSHKNQ